jgi:hypothetical protein
MEMHANIQATGIVWFLALDGIKGYSKRNVCHQRKKIIEE